MKKTYTNEQLKWLIDNYYDATWEEIFSVFPNRSKSFIKHLASNNKIKRYRVNPKIENLNDIIGKSFGRLIVINYIRFDGKNHIYMCKCDCGNYKEVTRRSLMSGNTKSCGCIHIETLIERNKKDTDYEKHHIRGIIKQIKSSAKARGYEFELNYDDVKKLVTHTCYYCKCEPSNIHKARCNKEEYGIFRYNGIDRIDSTKGYTIDNVVSCCRLCNIAKSTMSQREFYDWIQRVHDYYTEERIICT